MTNGPTLNRVTAQIACEAIVNHPDDGWEISDMVLVLADARAVGVPDLYVGMLADLLTVRMCEEGHAGE